MDGDPVVGIIDYGMGNLGSIVRVFQRLKIDARLVSTPEEIRQSNRLILPGVGHFKVSMEAFEATGLRSVVEEEVLGNKKPFLGVCVGMQMLALDSEEGNCDGLGFLQAHVRRFPREVEGNTLRVPHVGWSEIDSSTSPLLDGLGATPRFYFTHSYYMDANDEKNVIGKARYGIDFVAVVSSENIFGVQFHPEKSHSSGLNLLKNFVERC